MNESTHYGTGLLLILLTVSLMAAMSVLAVIYLPLLRIAIPLH